MGEMIKYSKYKNKSELLSI